jgi:hypothetical protein
MFFVSNNPEYPSYYYPVIAGFLLTMLVLYFVTSFIKTKISQNALAKGGNSFFDETLDPSKSYTENIVEKKNSLKFRYLVAYISTRASMWAKSPYMYTLFSKVHGFSISEIGILYIIDAVSALISGPILGNVADIFGRKMICMLYCLTTCTNLGLRLSGNKAMAYSAQILTGMGAGLITTGFESWVNCAAKKVFIDSSHHHEESTKALERYLKKLFKT